MGLAIHGSQVLATGHLTVPRYLPPCSMRKMRRRHPTQLVSIFCWSEVTGGVDARDQRVLESFTHVDPSELSAVQRRLQEIERQFDRLWLLEPAERVIQSQLLVREYDALRQRLDRTSSAIES